MGMNYTCGVGDTLDSWKPSEKPPENVIVQSEWRKNQIGKNFNQRPGIDEVKKIKASLKTGKGGDSEIMRVFGINAETLIAIKKGNYHPVDGIIPERSLSRYQLERLETLEKAVKFMSEVLFIDDLAMAQFLEATGHTEKAKKAAKEYDDFDEEEDFEG